MKMHTHTVTVDTRDGYHHVTIGVATTKYMTSGWTAIDAAYAAFRHRFGVEPANLRFDTYVHPGERRFLADRPTL